MGKIEKEYNERVQELKKVKNIDNLVNEGGEGYSSHDDQAAALFNHYAPLIKKERAEEFASEWTKEVFAARREAWNVLAKQGKKQAEIEKSVGFKMEALIKAKGIHA